MEMHKDAEFVTFDQLFNHYDGVSEEFYKKVRERIKGIPIEMYWDMFSEEDHAMINKALDNQWEPHFGQENLEN